MYKIASIILFIILVMTAIPVIAQSSSPVRLADFGIYDVDGGLPSIVPFTIVGHGGSYKKGQAVQPVTPNVYVYLVGNAESDDQIVINFYNSAGVKIGSAQEGVGQSGGNNTWIFKRIYCEKAKLPKAGNYSMDLSLVNKATSRNIALKKAKFSVEEITDRGGEQHLVINEDCHLKEGWLHNLNGYFVIAFFAKGKGDQLIPKVRLYCNGQQVGDVLNTEAPSTLNYAAQGVLCHTNMRYDEILAQNGNWEAKISINGEPARVLKWKVENGALGYHTEQPADKSAPRRLLADSRFVEVEVLQCPVEAKWNPESIKWPNMFFGRKPIGTQQ